MCIEPPLPLGASCWPCRTTSAIIAFQIAALSPDITPWLRYVPKTLRHQVAMRRTRRPRWIPCPIDKCTGLLILVGGEITRRRPGFFDADGMRLQRPVELCRAPAALGVLSRRSARRIYNVCAQGAARGSVVRGKPAANCRSGVESKARSLIGAPSGFAGVEIATCRHKPTTSWIIVAISVN